MEKQAVALSVVKHMQEMDQRGVGYVSIEEWLHHMLLLRAGPALRAAALPPVNAELEKALPANPTLLGDIQHMFELADRSACGSVSMQDIEVAYRELHWRFSPDGPPVGIGLTDEDIVAKGPKKLAQQLLEVMDLDGDGRVSYLEFLAFVLGRRKKEVSVHLYDLSKGIAQNIAPWVLGNDLEGVWHTGTVVYGREYHYARDTVHGEPGDTSFGKPTRVVRLGFTLWRKDEFHQFINAELKPIFQRDTYDVVCNNCNHFTDKICMWLVGKHPPEEVMRQPNVLMQSVGVRAMRPVLNWWLRDRIVVRGSSSFSQAEKLLHQAQQEVREQPPLASIVQAILGEDQPPVLGQVVTAPLHGNAPNFVCSDEWRDTSVQVIMGEAQPPFSCNCCSTAGEAPMVLGPCDPAFPASWSGDCSQWSGKKYLPKHQQMDSAWIQFFEIVPEPLGTCRGQVRTECVPFPRVSRMSLKEANSQELYTRAYAAISPTPAKCAEHLASFHSKVVVPGSVGSPAVWSDVQTSTTVSLSSACTTAARRDSRAHAPHGDVLLSNMDEELVPSPSRSVSVEI